MIQPAGGGQQDDSDFETIILFLRGLRSKGFFGTVTLGFQKGNITQIERKVVSKPGELLE